MMLFEVCEPNDGFCLLPLLPVHMIHLNGIWHKCALRLE